MRVTRDEVCPSCGHHFQGKDICLTPFKQCPECKKWLQFFECNHESAQVPEQVLPNIHARLFHFHMDDIPVCFDNCRPVAMFALDKIFCCSSWENIFLHTVKNITKYDFSPIRKYCDVLYPPVSRNVFYSNPSVTGEGKQIAKDLYLNTKFHPIIQFRIILSLREIYKYPYKAYRVEYRVDKMDDIKTHEIATDRIITLRPPKPAPPLPHPEELDTDSQLSGTDLHIETYKSSSCFLEDIPQNHQVRQIKKIDIFGTSYEVSTCADALIYFVMEVLERNLVSPGRINMFLVGKQRGILFATNAQLLQKPHSITDCLFIETIHNAPVTVRIMKSILQMNSSLQRSVTIHYDYKA